jgi:hypothetical protein
VGLVLSVSYGILVNRVVLSDDGVPKFARTLREVRSYSQGLDEFFAWPSDLGLLLFAALGFGVLMLLVVARQKKSNWQSPYLSFFICGFLCSILMLGMGGHWTQNSGLYELFFDYMPFFNKQRVPIKMYSTVATLLVILCLHVYDCLRNEAVMSPIKWRRYLSVGAAALVFVGIVGQPLRLFANGSRKILFENTQSGPLKLFAYLRQHTTLEDIILIQPTNDRMDVYSTLPQYFAVQTGRRFVQGYNGNPPASYYHIVNTQSTFSTGRPSRTAMEQIEKEGFTYLLHSKSAPASTRPEIINKAIGQMPFLEKKVCDGDFCLYKIEKSKVELAEFINYGLTGYQSYHGNTGQWMMREKSIVMTQGFSPEDFEEYKVISYFDSPLPDNQKPYKIRINLEMIKDMDLWIIQPGVEPLCVTVDEFEEQDRKKRHVIFEARSKYFYLATKDSWTAAEVGSTGAGEFAVFVKNIEVLK